MKGESVYLLDANIFIEASRRYYSCDIVPAFWEVLIELAKEGRVLSIDRVKAELERGDDSLAEWVTNHFNNWFDTTVHTEILSTYGQIMAWVSGQAQFIDSAKSEFARGADGWLVAYAKVHNCVIVTHEQYSPMARKTVPIPNVCHQFRVAYLDTFAMMRKLGVKLVGFKK